MKLLCAKFIRSGLPSHVLGQMISSKSIWVSALSRLLAREIMLQKREDLTKMYSHDTFPEDEDKIEKSNQESNKLAARR